MTETRTKLKSSGASRASKKKAAPTSAMLTSLPADWREEMLAEIRRLIVLADPEMVEERKWMKPTNPAGVPVWSHGGIVCTGETYKQVVKVTFMRGASLADPHGLFNSSLEGNARRAIDLREGETLNPTAFKALIKAAVAENLRSADSKGKPSPKTKAGGAAAKPVKLLSGGNPQIAKGDGDAPVQAYIAAMPGWKSDLGKRLDALIVRAVPKVRKAVKWNSPLYGVEEGVWFLGIHCFAKYIKVAFFRGAALRPIPPGESKQKDVRYLNLREDDVLDEVQFLAWVKQASQIPGERM